MIKQTKYLLVGQGLVGTWMSYYLETLGIPFKIINDPSIAAASAVASGVINPVTGRRIVQTWMIETLLPNAIKAYEAIGNKLDQKIIQAAPVLLMHPSQQMQESFEYRLKHENIYLEKFSDYTIENNFNLSFGMGMIKDCYWLDLNKLLETWKTYLKTAGHYIEDRFLEADIQFQNNKVLWKNFEADYLIFCDGNSSMQYSYFKSLPFAPNKGEALIVQIKGLSNQYIYKTNISIVPWKEDLFWVGSNYEWQFENLEPSLTFKEKMIASLNQYLKLPYTVVDHIVGLRPANRERRPFVGIHPNNPQMAICNGMGTKGCSLAPYFSKQLIEHMEAGSPIHPEADIQRFSFNE